MFRFITNFACYMASAKKPSLTPRERSIIQLICKEYTSDQVGEKLNISRRTVESHRARIMQKLRKRSVVGLVLYAVKHGLYTIR